MSTWTYLGIGLAFAHNDAWACYLMKREYHLVRSLLCSLAWPVLAVSVVLNLRHRPKL
jgi:hypothetical protein